MNGAESLVQTLLDGGVEVCFTNPGTSEMHFVAALDEVPGMRCVLCLFEGVVSGAADGYGRMAGKPASTLLHLGPGLGNAVANLHNARKGNVGIVNVVGDHATYHVQYDAPLTADIEGLAGPVSHWVRTSQTAAGLPADTAEAVAHARRGEIATLILPADTSWSNDSPGAAPLPPVSDRATADPDALQQAVNALAAGSRCMILMGGTHVTREHAAQMDRLAQSRGVRVALEGFLTRVAGGEGMAPMERIPYFAEKALAVLEELDHIVLLGCKTPVSFFAYPGIESLLVPDGCQVHELVGPWDDIDGTLEGLVAAVGAENIHPRTLAYEPPELPSGRLTEKAVAAAFAHLLPENAIVADEAVTSGALCYPFAEKARRHDWMMETGGAIGWGIPAAVGAAVACPDRKVVCLSGDGSAMYTLQGLWTIARENLDVTVIIFANQSYAILEIEFARTGARGGIPGPNAAQMLSLANPDLDFVQMAAGMGISATRASTADEFVSQYGAAMNQKGPHLIEAMMSEK